MADSGVRNVASLARKPAECRLQFQQPDGRTVIQALPGSHLA